LEPFLSLLSSSTWCVEPESYCEGGLASGCPRSAAFCDSAPGQLADGYALSAIPIPMSARRADGNSRRWSRSSDARWVTGQRLGATSSASCFQGRLLGLSSNARRVFTQTGPYVQLDAPRASDSDLYVPWSPCLPGFTNLRVIRSDSPIARYLSRSLSPSVSVGGRVHTPCG
jgi:hypothetical protein